LIQLNRINQVRGRISPRGIDVLRKQADDVFKGSLRKGTVNGVFGTIGVG